MRDFEYIITEIENNIKNKKKEKGYLSDEFGKTFIFRKTPLLLRVFAV